MIEQAAAAAMGALLKGPLDHHLDIEGSDGEFSLYTSSGSLVSLFDWRGSRELRGEKGMSEVASGLRSSLAAWFAAPGHAIQILFCRDPAAAEDEAARAVAPAAAQASALSLELNDIFEDRRTRLARGGVWERVLLIAYTHPAAGARREGTVYGPIPLPERLMLPLRDVQMPVRASERTRLLHAALVDSLPADFRRAGQEIRPLPTDEAARMIAWSLSPAEGEVGFTPRLATGTSPAVPGRPCRAARAPCTKAALTGADYSPVGLERLSWQLLRSHAEVEGPIVRIGNTIAYPFDVAVLPETLVPFRDLLTQAADSDGEVRWRFSFLIEGAGLQGTALKRMFVTVLTFLARTHNTRIRDAFHHLQELDGTEETAVRMRCCAACWDVVGNEDRLRRSTSRLRHAIERWSNARTDELAGDPVACLFGSVPGGGCAPTAPPAVAPLTDALCLLPLDRPASPWRNGPLTLVSRDGKFWPYRPGSVEQDSWCDIISGAPGSGKSVLLNAMNAAALLSGRGRDEPLPWISVIDVGASSTGLVEMIRHALPADRRHLVASARLQNAGDHAINVFDTPIGCRHPTALGKTFIVNFLRLMLAEVTGGEDLRGLISLAVDEAYTMSSEDGRPRRWHSRQNAEVDAALEETGWSPDDSSTWWECADHLSVAGRWPEAALAQRMAVPLLADLTAAAASPRVMEIYSEMRVSATKEAAITAFQRVLTEAAAEWPLLSMPTRFAMTEAHVRVIDLQDVTSRSQDPAAVRRSAMMYLLARHVCTDGHYLTNDELRSVERTAGLQPCQKERLQQHAAAAQATPKRLCFDEFHRTGGLPGVVDQVETDVREGRKAGVQVVLASQLLSDFSGRLLSLATGVWICSAGPEEIDLATRLLNLDDSSRQALRHRLTGPGPDGSPIFAALDCKGGPVRQLLVHRLGAAEIWAYSTTAEDVALRTELSRRLGPEGARAALAREWPAGSARRELRRLRDDASDRGRAGTVISQLADDVAARWRSQSQPGRSAHG